MEECHLFPALALKDKSSRLSDRSNMEILKSSKLGHSEAIFAVAFYLGFPGFGFGYTDLCGA
jgi:hypothetical protein